MVHDNDTKRGSEFIFVAGPGRCGTSLLAGIFAQQGAWTGSARTQPHKRAVKGFYENVDFRAWLRVVCEARGVFPDARRGVQEVSGHLPPNAQAQFEAPLRAAGWTPGTPIILKNPLVVYAMDILDACFPYAQWVIARRPKDQIVYSQMRGYGGDPNQWGEWVDWYYEQIEAVPHYDIDIEKLVQMERTQVDQLMQVAMRAGIKTWEPKKIRDFIVPGALHV